MNHTLRILSLAFIYLVAPTFAADPKAEPKGEVIEFGTFELAGPQRTVPNAKTLDGAERNAPAARFTRQTDKIPAQVGIQFGFRFKLTNLPEAASVDLKTIVKHPPIKDEKGIVEREYTLTTTLPVKDGYVSEVTGYSLDRPEELVPGVWVFEHWYRGQKLVSQSFTVVAPDKPPTKAPTVLFEDNFAGKLGPGWQWLRERPEHWRIADGSLIIDTLPGSYWQKENSGQNTLLRKAPASLEEGFIIEVHMDNTPKGQWEHAGLLCYFDPFTFVAFNKEFTGKQCIFVFHQQDGKPIPGPGETDYKESGVWLRLTMRGTKATAQYRSSEKEPWQPIGECAIPTSNKELLVGFQSGYGDEKSGRQAHFRSFRILKASE